MKFSFWVVLLLGVSLATTVSAEDFSSRLAQVEQPLLDRRAETERPDPTVDRPDPDQPETITVEQEVVPVLEPARADDTPGNVRGNRMERRWRIIPFGRFRMIWDDNLFISNTNRESDLSFTLSPGIAAGWGDYSAEIRQLGEFEHVFEPLDLSFDEAPQSFLFAKYNLNGSLFSDHSSENALDHDALLAGRWEASKLTLGTRMRYQTLSGTDIDVGDRVKRHVFQGVINSSYKFSEKSSLDLNTAYSDYDYETQIDWNDWLVEGFLNYQYRPKTQFSIGTRYGITNVQGGSNQTYEQALARVSYYASSKLAFVIDGGVEWRQYDNGPDKTNGVFNFSTSYAPFDGTTLSVSAYRRNTASASLVNENITSTGFNARVRQRFMHRFYFTVDGGFQNSKYVSTVSESTGVSREDDTTYVKPGVSFDITKNLSAEAAYQYQQNDSSLEDTTFTENLVTLQLNLQF